MTSHNDERVHDRRHPRHRRRLAMTRDSLALTIGQNESVLLGGFLGRHDDASMLALMTPSFGLESVVLREQSKHMSAFDAP